MPACHDRRMLDRPDRIVSRDPTAYGDVLCGPSRYRLKMQGSQRWVSRDNIHTFTSDPQAALCFASRLEAFAFIRSFDDEDGNKTLMNTASIEVVPVP